MFIREEESGKSQNGVQIDNIAYNAYIYVLFENPDPFSTELPDMDFPIFPYL